MMAVVRSDACEILSLHETLIITTQQLTRFFLRKMNVNDIQKYLFSYVLDLRYQIPNVFSKILHKHALEKSVINVE